MIRSSDLKLHQLQYLIAIAEQGSLRLAAQSLGVSAAAVSKGLQDLENTVGLRLLERQSQGLVITAAGRTLLAHARLAVGEIDEAMNELNRLQNKTETRLSVGVTPWISQSLLPSAIRRFLAVRPDVSLNLVETVGTAYAALREGTVDVAIGLTPPQDTANDLISRPLFSYGQAVICRRGHPRQNARSLDSLADQSWILSHEVDQYKPPLRDFFVNAYKSASATSVGRLHYARSSIIVLPILEDSDLLTVVPWPFIEAARVKHRIEALALNDILPENTTSYLTRRNTPTNGAIGQFIEALMTAADEDGRTESGLLRRIFHSVDIVQKSS